MGVLQYGGHVQGYSDLRLKMNVANGPLGPMVRVTFPFYTHSSVLTSEATACNVPRLFCHILRGYVLLDRGSAVLPPRVSHL